MMSRGPSNVRWIAALTLVWTVSGCTLVGKGPSGATTPAGPSTPAERPRTGSGADTGSNSTASNDVPADIMAIPDAQPVQEVQTRSGNPRRYSEFGETYHVMETSEGYEEEGIASWYGPGFHGRRTSSGDTYDMYKMTAAHTVLPLPTYVEVTNLENGRKVVVRVNDRGPFHEGRIIDLSYVAAMKLGIVQAGTARVRVKALDPPATPRGGEDAP